jgi:hypothetical protein
VLAGALGEQSFEVGRDAESALGLYSVSSDYGVGASNLALKLPHVVPTTTQSLIRTPEGRPYLIPTGLHHSSIGTSDDWTVSLVATEAVEGAASTVVAPMSIGVGVSNARRPSTDLELLPSLLAGRLG